MSGSTTALIIPAVLPPALETLRQLGSAAARLCCPAHVTLLYPFIATQDLNDVLVERIRARVERHASFAFALTGPEHWPDAIYLAPHPTAPVDALCRDLLEAFPEWPIYAGRFAFEPHLSLVDGMPSDDTWLARARADSQGLLPIETTATECLLIARDDDGPWRTVHRFALGRRTRDG